MADPIREAARQEVAARGLTANAVAHLTHDALGAIDFAALAPTKKLLKQFFSDEPWTADDDAALATLVGSGAGWWRHDLDADFVLEFGWRDGVFGIDISSHEEPGATFDGPVVPEATPNPRSIRFVTPPIHDGPSRWYESAAGVDDPRVVRVFAEFDDVANVLVGPSFVAVGIRHPDRWEQLLDPMLGVITDEFADTAAVSESVIATDTAVPNDSTSTSAESAVAGGTSALELAWKELGSLRPDVSTELEAIVAATSAPTSAHRQVAARLLADADPDLAARVWSRLVEDSSRSVRRATVDVMVDVERPSLRPILERALGDADAWTRWKALRGLVDLGVEPSRPVVAPLVDDPDFRVRLEVARAMPDLDRS